MSTIDFIHDHETFAPLWQRACAYVQTLTVTQASDSLHFDSSNIGTQVFQNLV